MLKRVVIQFVQPPDSLPLLTRTEEIGGECCGVCSNEECFIEYRISGLNFRSDSESLEKPLPLGLRPDLEFTRRRTVDVYSELRRLLLGAREINVLVVMSVKHAVVRRVGTKLSRWKIPRKIPRRGSVSQIQNDAIAQTDHDAACDSNQNDRFGRHARRLPGLTIRAKK